MRMSVRQFAGHLGVSDRTVSKWDAGGEDIVPRPEMQAILDTALQRSDAEVTERFQVLVSETRRTASVEDLATERSTAPFAMAVHPVDGKPMVPVPAGEFLFGSGNESRWLDAFYIDMTLTTNTEYGAFVASTGHQSPAHWVDGTCPGELADHPVVNVSYDDAIAYAEWAGKFLPTAEQWEKAARGERGRVYPWGDQATPAKCNVRESGVGRTTPVERYHSGVSPYQVYDLSGNVWEWCATETEPGRFVLKGSAFTSPFSMAMAAATNDANATMRDDDTGFRCVADPGVFDRLTDGVR